MVTTNNKELYKKIIRNRTHGITKNQEEFVLKDFGPWSYEQQSLGYNYRITDIQAALGLSQLKRLDKIVEERNRLLNFYKSILKDLPFSLLEIPEYTQSSVHLAVLKFNDISKEIYKKIFLDLRKNNIGVQLHYSPVHLQPFYRNLGFKEGDFPNAENYSHTSISLPIYPGLEEKEQIYVAHNLERISKEFNLH